MTSDTVTVGNLIESGDADEIGWRQMAARVADLTLGALATENLVQGVIGSFPAAAPNVYLDYTASMGYFNPPGTCWGAAIPDGRGLFLYFYDSEVETSDQLPDMISVDGVGRHGDVTAVFGASSDDAYLAGNPWVGSLDLSAMFAQRGAVMSDAVYVWEPSGGGGYTEISRTLGEVVAPWQGFWVEILSATDPVSITYASMSMTTGGVFVGKERRKSIAMRRIGFDLSGAGPDGQRTMDRAAAIVFAEGATDEYDAFDARRPAHPGGSFSASR